LLEKRRKQRTRVARLGDFSERTYKGRKKCKIGKKVARSQGDGRCGDRLVSFADLLGFSGFPLASERKERKDMHFVGRIGQKSTR
jgi:hypothetical protein